jgi:HD-GYP domain-containing protein (c-di-GMP phosphodiesterase class II)
MPKRGLLGAGAPGFVRTAPGKAAWHFRVQSQVERLISASRAAVLLATAAVWVGRPPGPAALSRWAWLVIAAGFAYLPLDFRSIYGRPSDRRCPHLTAVADLALLPAAVAASRLSRSPFLPLHFLTNRREVRRMHIVILDEHAVGRHLGRSIRDDAGHILLRAGTRLSRTYIRALRDRGYRTVYAVNELAPDIGVDDALREETRTRATQVVRSALEKAARAEKLEISSLRKIVDEILAELRGQSDTAFSVATIRSVDEYTFVHSVNVCLYCLMLGTALAYDTGTMRKLALGALLHDIGKTNYPELVKRAGPLTAEEFAALQGHTTDGYEMLRNHDGVDLLSAHMAFQHHERLDGSGYPRGLRDEQILPFARIAAVADVYDAMTGDRPYKPAMAPHEAMAVILEQAGTKLDAYLVRQFAQRIAVYPAGTIVGLSDGRIGVVSAQTDLGPTRPCVRVLTDETQQLAPPVEVTVGGKLSIRSALKDYPAAVRRQMAATAAR